MTDKYRRRVVNPMTSTTHPMLDQIHSDTLAHVSQPSLPLHSPQTPRPTVAHSSQPPKSVPFETAAHRLRIGLAVVELWGCC